MRRLYFLTLVVFSILACDHSPARSKYCFDDIRDMVNDKSAAEVEEMLGEPDTRQPGILADERWIWWDYTFLDGDDYPPEMRGQVVHLEILFERPPGSDDGPPPPYSQWQIGDPLGISYSIPAKTL